MVEAIPIVEHATSANRGTVARHISIMHSQGGTSLQDSIGWQMRGWHGKSLPARGPRRCCLRAGIAGVGNRPLR
jgi:hypothetical protein